MSGDCRTLLTSVARAATQATDVIAHAAMLRSRILLFTLVVMTAVEVVLRTLFHGSLLITSEMAGYLLAAMVSLGDSHSMRKIGSLAVMHHVGLSSFK